jgi:haloalkane dehalogenase
VDSFIRQPHSLLIQRNGEFDYRHLVSSPTLDDSHGTATQTPPQPTHCIPKETAMTTLTPLSRRPLLAVLAAALIAPAIVTNAAADPSAAPAASAPLSAAFAYTKSFVTVRGSKMAYVDVGRGPVVLFIHGNPTSSYLWRNVIPYVSGTHRVIAVDLIGMGDSDKPAIDYRFADQAAYLDAFIGQLGLKNITLVVHDWGSALGMRYARLNPSNVKAIAFMEALIPPTFPAAAPEALGPQFGPLMSSIRTAGTGEKMVLEQNFFVNVMLGQHGSVRPLTAEALAEYQRPFPTPESRKPTLAFPRELPIGGTPSDTVAEISANGAWLASATIPKLMFHATPGAVAPAPVVEAIKATVTGLETISVGPGRHFLQEDNPQAIGEGLARWLAQQAR